jgi:NAD(P)-dependent dehydrogenase (short-subunit alcohol dehydrogenase family)
MIDKEGAVTTTSPRRVGRLDRRVAIVTGAARGIGRACAVALAAEGADLALIDVAEDIEGCTYPLGTAAQLRATAGLCQDHGAAVTIHYADVRSAADLVTAVGDILDRLGGADILVNNAGLATPAGRPAHALDEDQWRLMVDVDLTGAWRMMRLVVPHMLDRRAGSVVNIASTAGVVGYPHFANYTAAKHGLVGLTRAAALDYATSGVRVNALCPGSVRDEPELEGRMLGGIADALDIPSDRHEQVFIDGQPTRRLVSAYDVANACVWLASDDSRGVTGSVITVDGAYTAR